MMTNEEFEAVLAVEGRELRKLIRAGFAMAENTYIVRVVEPVKPDDVDEGPYRYEGMERTILEISSDVDHDTALGILKGVYVNGNY